MDDNLPWNDYESEKDKPDLRIFIELKSVTDTPLWVNSEHIAAYTEVLNNAGGFEYTSLYMATGDHINTLSREETITSKLKELGLI